MRWRRQNYYVRPLRPKARALNAAELERISARLKAAIDDSPILTAFGVQVRTLRNRFYLEWRWDPVDRPDETSAYGRITPVDEPSRQLLLEVPHGQNQWSRVGSGSPEKLIELAANDKKGTFHG